jgi:hypothetical protein
VNVALSYIKRSEANVSLKKVHLTGFEKDTTLTQSLNNELNRITFPVTIPANQPLTQPYWLAEKKMGKGMYRVDDASIIGLPEKPADLQAELTFTIEGKDFTFKTPVIYKYTDEVRGELYRTYEIRPEVTANIADKVYVFADNQPKEVEVTLKANKADARGSVALEVPKGWKVDPTTTIFQFSNKYQEQKVVFKVSPADITHAGASEATFRAVVTTPSGTSDKGLLTVAYDHIPPQTLFPVAEAKIVKLDIKKKGNNIGYIMGAGDEVAAALRQIGYKVTMLGEKELDEDLSKYDAIVVGVRAYNTEPRLKFYQKKLMEYVQNGGNMVVQYQVNNNLQKIDGGLGPYDFKLSRDRVTVEEAEIRF